MSTSTLVETPDEPGTPCIHWCGICHDIAIDLWCDDPCVLCRYCTTISELRSNG